MNDETKNKMYRKHKCQFTKNLRKNMTLEEKVLWQILRNRNLRGVKFCRQVNIGPYIVDFLCREHKIVIELDGGIHNRVEQKEYDRYRDDYLRELGYQIMRIKNESIHQNLKLVLHNIYNFIRNNKQPTTPSPSQRRGLG